MPKGVVSLSAAMKLTDLQTKLIRAARLIPADERVPYAFEKRIMARLGLGAQLDAWTFWGRALWRAAGSCLAITIVSSAWTLWSPHRESQPEFSQELESAVFASASLAYDSIEYNW